MNLRHALSPFLVGIGAVPVASSQVLTPSSHYDNINDNDDNDASVLIGSSASDAYGINRSTNTNREVPIIETKQLDPSRTRVRNQKNRLQFLRSSTTGILRNQIEEISDGDRKDDDDKSKSEMMQQHDQQKKKNNDDSINAEIGSTDKKNSAAEDATSNNVRTKSRSGSNEVDIDYGHLRYQQRNVSKGRYDSSPDGKEFNETVHLINNEYYSEAGSHESYSDVKQYDTAEISVVERRLEYSIKECCASFCEGRFQGRKRPVIKKDGLDFQELIRNCVGEPLPDSDDDYTSDGGYYYNDDAEVDDEIIIDFRRRKLSQNCPSYIHPKVPIGCWDTSRVTDMSYAFRSQILNQPINCWNVQSVTDMNGMFYEASNFNQPLHYWNVSRVKDMGVMFYEAGKFNQPIDLWDVGGVTKMDFMFAYASDFNQCLSSWADKTPSGADNKDNKFDNYSLLVGDTSCPFVGTHFDMEGTPDPNQGPWCQGPADGCTVEGGPAPMTTCSFLEDHKKQKNSEPTPAPFSTESEPPSVSNPLTGDDATDEPTFEPTIKAVMSFRTAVSTTTPSMPSMVPSDEPSVEPTDEPSNSPTDEPSNSPTDEPSNSPTEFPTDTPSSKPSEEPSTAPTEEPTDAPTGEPSMKPTDKPTAASPTVKPTRPPPTSRVANDSVTDEGTTEDQIENGMQVDIDQSVNGQRRSRNLREGRALEEGTCRVVVDATINTCGPDITDRTKVCFAVNTIIQEPQPGQGNADACDVNAGANLTGARLRRNEILAAGDVDPDSVVIVLATEQPSSQPSQVPSVSPSLSLVPTEEFPCLDDENFRIRVALRRRTRLVNGCAFVGQNRERCNKGTKAPLFRRKCPEACRIPVCTCIDSDRIIFRVGRAKFTKQCMKINRKFCEKSEKVRIHCPMRCEVDRCKA